MRDELIRDGVVVAEKVGLGVPLLGEHDFFGMGEAQLGGAGFGHDAWCDTHLLRRMQQAYPAGKSAGKVPAMDNLSAWIGLFCLILWFGSVRAEDAAAPSRGDTLIAKPATTQAKAA